MSNVILTASSTAAREFLPLITNKGILRSSKPKDGNAAYVWRMVGFQISMDARQRCMPMTADFGFGVVVPEDFMPEAPEDYIQAEIELASRSEADVAFCTKHSPDGTLRGYVISRWGHHKRRRAYIKSVLDPIVKEIVDAVPARELHGVRRWGKALGAF